MYTTTRVPIESDDELELDSTEGDSDVDVFTSTRIPV